MPKRGECGRRIRVRRRQDMQRAEHDQKSGGAERKRRRDGDDAARRRKRGFERHDDKPDRGERRDAAGRRGNRRHQAGQRQRRQNVRALVAAGARQEIGGEDRRDQPGEHQEFDRARRAADEQINRKQRQSDDAAEQPRRDERAMARRRQRVLLRRRMDQRLNIISVSARTGPRSRRTRALQTRSPCSDAGSCQSAA